MQNLQKHSGEEISRRGWSAGKVVITCTFSDVTRGFVGDEFQCEVKMETHQCTIFDTVTLPACSQISQKSFNISFLWNYIILQQQKKYHARLSPMKHKFPAIIMAFVVTMVSNTSTGTFDVGLGPGAFSIVIYPDSLKYQSSAKAEEWNNIIIQGQIQIHLLVSSPKQKTENYHPGDNKTI